LAAVAAGPELIRSPELSELETFVLAVEEGSLSRAARRLRISTQAAAKRVRQIEALADAPLLVRTSRGVSATATGERLYPIARDLLARRGQAVGALRGDSAGPPGDLVAPALAHSGEMAAAVARALSAPGGGRT
jgi:DNA-binding transcriptional LysR family regulator